MKAAAIAITAGMMASPAIVMAGTPTCPPGTTNCNLSTQTMGDTQSSADNGQTESSNSGTSSADNNASYTGGTAGDLQQSNNLVDQSGAKQESRATGGDSSAYGNYGRNSSSNHNRSHASNGDMIGTNTMGSMTDKVNGDQSMTGTNTMGSMTGTLDGTYSGTNKQGQKQGIARSGNAHQGQSANNDQGQGQSQSGVNKQGQVGINKQGIRGAGNSHQGQGQSMGQGQDAHNRQGQGQRMGQGQSVANRNGQSANNHQGQDAHNRQAQSQRNRGNNAKQGQKTKLDASDHSTHSVKIDARTKYRPRVTTPVVPSVNPGEGVSTVAGRCGPLRSVRHKPYNAHYMGFLVTTNLKNGTEDYLSPYVDRNGSIIQYKAVQNPDSSWTLWGNRAIYFTTVLNTSGSRQIGAGATAGFTGGQASGGSSSAIQRMVINIRMDPCVIGTIPAPPTPEIAENLEGNR